MWQFIGGTTGCHCGGVFHSGGHVGGDSGFICGGDSGSRIVAGVFLSAIIITNMTFVGEFIIFYIVSGSWCVNMVGI